LLKLGLLGQGVASKSGEAKTES